MVGLAAAPEHHSAERLLETPSHSPPSPLVLGSTNKEVPEAEAQAPHDDRPERGAVANFDDGWGRLLLTVISTTGRDVTQLGPLVMPELPRNVILRPT